MNLSRRTEIVIRPGRQPLNQSFAEFFEYRDLLFTLIRRQLSVKYKQTSIGIIWVIVQPLMTALIMTVVFGNFAKLPSDGIPYPVFAYSAMVLWNLFAQGVDRASGSLVANQQLITKVYFPRLMIPIAAIGSCFVDFAMSLVVLLVIAFAYGFHFSIHLLLIPVLALTAGLLAAGIGILISGLNVKYRDFQHTVPFMMQIWLYASPVAYSAGIVSGPLKKLYFLNPMAGLIEWERFAITGQGHPDPMAFVLAASIAISVLVVGIGVFRRVEPGFADFI